MFYGTDLNHDCIRKIIVCRNLGGFLFVCLCVHFKVFTWGHAAEAVLIGIQLHIHWI